MDAALPWPGQNRPMIKRTDNDTWNLARSVGATATMVAAARAAASRQADSIIHDPFAEPLVRQAGIDFFARLARGDLEFADIDTGWMPDFFAVRAHFFDTFVARLRSAPLPQAVIVASGLDSRAYRLEWPANTVVYEIDQPAVIAFKESTMAGLGATPNVQLRTVAADLRQDWPTALQQKGFDRKQPTAWLVEGLMIGYLPGDAQERLLEQITELSAAGSTMAADHLPGDSRSLGSLLRDVTAVWKERGCDLDFDALVYPHERNDAGTLLEALGWSTSEASLAYLVAAANLTNHGIDTGPNGPGAITYLTAIRSAR